MRPVLGSAKEIAAHLRVARGELDTIFLEAEGLEDRFGKVEARDDFAFNLLWRTEDVRIVLREAAHAQEAVHGAGALVTVDVAEFGVALLGEFL